MILFTHGVAVSHIIPPRIVRKHEDYISRMSLLSGNLSSRSPENFHTIIESLPTSTTFIEDSDSNREEIDIFSRPDDSIPPGIEIDFDSEEDIIDNLLNDDPIPEYECLTFDMEPDMPVINNVYELNEDECFDPGGGSGYQQKDRKPSQNDKTEHRMEKTVQNQGQSPKMPKSAVKPEPELKNTIGCNLNPSDGPGKPNSIIMKTVKTKWALNQFQQPICVQLTKTVKTLKAQS
ncbi:hypothetical protein Tco_0916939 [Tanacetum coccineum]